MSRIACPPPSVPAAFFCAALCAFALAACSGSRPEAPLGDGGSSTLGDPCQFDSDCTPAPPASICGSEGTCIAGCGTAGCPSGDSCNASSGHCTPRPDAGTTTTDGGTDEDGGTVTPDGGTTGTSPTLCQPCTTNSDCQDNGLCISDPTHTYDYCTQDCTSTACPTGYLCTTDSTNTQHQCIPSGGACANAPDAGTNGSDGGTSTGSDGGTGPTDPTNPSTNANGADQCSGCNVNDDCIEGAICVGSSDTGIDDGFCEKSCNPSNSTTLVGITIYTDCITAACEADIAAFDIEDAITDCLTSYSVCGNVSGTNATFCNPELGCGSSTALP